MQQLASQNAPSPSIVIPHFVFGGITWLVITVVIIFFPEAFTQHYFNPKLLAITHLLVLGWITMVIFGALYQLIPVIMGVKLYSERLAIASFVLLACGAVMLAVSFWNFWLGTILHIAASLLFLAVTFFAINVFITCNRSTQKSIEKDFIQTSVIWLLFTVFAGIALAVNLTHPFLLIPHLELLKLHAHAGIVGWFIQLIIGVGSKLLPMFMIAHKLDKRKLKFSYYLINLGLIIGITCLYSQWWPGIVVSVIMVIAGIISFLSFLTEAFRKRIKKQLDIGMMQSAFSFVMLTIPLLLVLLLVFDAEVIRNLTIPMAVAYGSTLLIGFITSLIMGQTYKTLPIIVWLKEYRKLAGKGKIPFPKDLYSYKAATAQLWCFAIGFVCLFLGVLLSIESLVRVAGVLVFISAVLYNFNILKIVLHKPIVVYE